MKWIFMPWQECYFLYDGSGKFLCSCDIGELEQVKTELEEGKTDANVYFR